MRKRLCKFNGVAVMRKTLGMRMERTGAERRIGWIVVCVRKFEARSLVRGTGALHACRRWKAPSEGDPNWSFMQRLRCEKVENGVGAGQQKVSR